MLNSQIAKYRALENWFRKEQGKLISHEIGRHLSEVPSCLHGDVLLQIGGFGQNQWLSCFNSVHQWVISPDQSNKRAELICPIEQLSLKTASVDILFAPFALEIFSNPQVVLEEFDRVLKPMGCIIIIGINPYSLWSMASRFGKLNCFGDYSPHIHSTMRIQHRLSRLGYEQMLHQGFWYLPPLEQQSWIKRLSIVNEMGKILGPFPSGFYFHVARKYNEAISSPRQIKSKPEFYKGLQPGW